MMVIVLGMHRSGTSAMAGVLHNNGIIMGAEDTWFPPPMKENPMGFFENHQFRMVNDQLLKENNYRVKSFDPDVPAPDQMKISATVAQEMIYLLAEYDDRYKNWGFKDPRTCLTLRYWIQAAGVLGLKYKVILMRRNNISIANSMECRGNKGGIPKLALCATSYYEAAKAHYWNVRGSGDFMEIEFNNLMYHTDNALDNISKFLGMPLKERTHIKQELVNHTAVAWPD